MRTPHRPERFILAAGLAAALTAGIATPSVAADAATNCALEKRAAADKLASGFLKCVATAVGKGSAVDPLCGDKHALKFGLLFDKAEAVGGCLVAGDAGSVQAVVESCVAGVRSELGTSSDAAGPASKCSSAKLKSTAKKLTMNLKCHATAVKKPAPVAPACLDKAETTFVGGFAKAESKGDCLTTGDTAAVEAVVDDCLADVLAAVAVPSTTTSSTITPTTTTSTSTSIPAGCDAESLVATGVTGRHNLVRATVDPPASPALPPLCYDADVEASAQAWADGCNYAHSGSGENLYAYVTTGSPPPTPQLDAVDSWADEAADYNYGPNTCDAGKVCGHYTQIVWRNTTRLGCGVKQCSAATSPFGPPFDAYPWWYVVCQYEPPGNVVGQHPY